MGISGGVDSAVSAALLKEQGYDLVGVHLYCYDEGPYCTAPEDRASAVRVAEHLGIPLKIWDLRKEYKERVIRYFFDEYQAGRTPNPDIMCNREIKFGLFLDKARKELKVDYVATGHYARVKSDKEGPRLLAGADHSKDQSYFLYPLTQDKLEHILFPIGGMTKKEVRTKAGELNLPNKSRPDSQGICFIGPVNVAKFLRENLPAKKGRVVTADGQVIGEHDGVWFFTEGQRHGFLISNSPGLPLYVVGKNVTTNTLIVGRGEESKVREFWVKNPHWTRKLEDKGKKRPGLSAKASKKVGVRIRHLGEIMPAIIISNSHQPPAASHKLLVKLAKPMFGVAAGQSAVFYQKDEVLGGGIISLGSTL